MCLWKSLKNWSVSGKVLVERSVLMMCLVVLMCHQHRLQVAVSAAAGWRVGANKQRTRLRNTNSVAKRSRASCVLQSSDGEKWLLAGRELTLISQGLLCLIVYFNTTAAVLIYSRFTRTAHISLYWIHLLLSFLSSWPTLLHLNIKYKNTEQSDGPWQHYKNNNSTSYTFDYRNNSQEWWNASSMNMVLDASMNSRSINSKGIWPTEVLLSDILVLKLILVLVFILLSEFLFYLVLVF